MGKAQWLTLIIPLIWEAKTGGDFRQTVDIGFTGAEVAAFNGVVKQAVNGVAVVLVVLGRVNAALGRNGVARRGLSW